jgi:hypothetical protein
MVPENFGRDGRLQEYQVESALEKMKNLHKITNYRNDEETVQESAEESSQGEGKQDGSYHGRWV